MGGGDKRRPVLRHTNVLGDTHKDTGFCSCLLSLGHVDVHFVTVEVGIVRCTDALIEAEGLVVHNLCLVCHD